MEQTSYDKDLKPVLLIPALPESDMDYKDIIYVLQNHTVCVTPRGRELSDAPEKGYSLEDHANDIIDTINHFALQDLIVIAYSRGVTYFLEALPKISEKILGFVIIDFPAQYDALPDEWPEKFLKRSWRAMPNRERFPKPWVLERIFEESKPKKYWNNLKGINCQVTLMYGTTHFSDPALVSTKITEEHLEHYQKILPQINIIKFEESGHDLRLWEYEKFVSEIRKFIDDVTPKPFGKQKSVRPDLKKTKSSTRKTYFGLEKGKEIKLQ